MGDFLTEKSEFMLERQWKKFPATSIRRSYQRADLYPSNKNTGIPFQGSYYKPKQCIIRSIRRGNHQNDHTCALFDLPKIGNLITLAF